MKKRRINLDLPLTDKSAEFTIYVEGKTDNPVEWAKQIIKWRDELERRIHKKETDGHDRS